MMHMIRLIAATLLLYLAVFSQTVAPAYAQQAPEETQTQDAAPLPLESTAPQQELQEQQPSPDVAVGAPNISDDVQQKLKALEQAEQDFLNAVRSQESRLDVSNGTDAVGRGDLDTTSNTPKSSFLPTSLEEVKALGMSVMEKVVNWLTSPSFLAQIAAIALSYFLAPILASQIKRRIFLFRDPPPDDAKLRLVREYIYRSNEFLRAVMLVALLALSAMLLKAIPALGQDWLVKLAQGLAVVFLVYRAIKTFLPNPLIQKLATWIVIPLALLMVFGYWDNLLDGLNSTVLMSMGDTPITAMTVVRLLIFGAIFFKLGSFSNDKGQTAIRSQETLDASTREVVAKIFQILLFTIMVILVLSAAKVPLSGLVMIFSALSLGVGLGLQPIAANFVSGMIILFDRSVQVGDFVVLPDGQSGFVDAINMRSTTVETTDGKDIMVPNTQFTEDAYENWTHKDPSQRYEVEFLVHYETDLDGLEEILMPAIMAYPQLLTEPEMPDLEFRGFEDHGIKMAIEFWCNGIDDGANKFTSDIGFIIWRTLKANKITIPYPQTEVRLLK